tara:strand:- start:2859 stop:3428 length:570 start_codon:yes stop_codon:yes gene_type:complete
MSRWKTKIRYGYTTNGEFINTLTTDTYEGPFFEQRGKYYESNPNSQTLSRFELTRIPVELNNANTKKYNELTDGTFQPRQIIQPYFPIPKDSDYQNSFFTRYIVQKRNERQFIYEVSSANYSEISASPLFASATLEWQLIGTPEDVAKKNADEIRKASADIIGLRDFLTILTEFNDRFEADAEYSETKL